MNNLLARLIGLILIVAGVLGALGGLGEVNPIASFSDPLYDFTLGFLSETAAVVFWLTIIVLGLTFAGPQKGYTDAAFQLVRKKWFNRFINNF